MNEPDLKAGAPAVLPSPPNITLAVDASGKTAGVCILEGETVRFERTLDEGLTHSETLLPLVMEALAGARLTLREVSLLAVTAGPGSFTGLRIAMALVKGLALPGNIPTVGVSTLHALAAGCAVQPNGPCGTLVAALDARRSEVYWAAFDTRGPLRRLTEDAAGPVGDIKEAGLLKHPPVFFVGSGAEMCYNVFDYTGGTERPGLAEPPAIAKGAAFIARARCGETDAALPAAGLRPVYLRLSQAERERAAKAGEPTPRKPLEGGTANVQNHRPRQ